MFGRRGLFGRNVGVGQMPQNYMPPQAMSDQSQSAPKSGGFFREGGVGRQIAGTIGDVLLQSAGMQPVFGPQMQIQQIMGARNAEAQRQQSQMMAAAQAAGISPEQAALLGPEGMRQIMVGRMQPQQAPAPDAFDRALIGAGIDPKSPEAVEMYRRRAESMTRDPNDEFVVVPIPGRGTYAGPRSGMPSAFGQQPAAPARRSPGPRPQGMTDDELFEQGRKAVEQGAPVEEVFQRLKAWGVKVT